MNDSPVGTGWDLGPDLRNINDSERRKYIKRYIWQHQRIQIGVAVAAAIFLIIGVIWWDVLQIPTHFQNAPPALSVSPTNWGDWLMRMQSFSGIGTLLIALFVWYGEICEDWQNQLPKRMSVFFFHKGCWFTWDEIPGVKDDANRLTKFLSSEYGIEWASRGKIEKIDNGKIIKISDGENHLLLKLNDEKTVATLEINDGRTSEFKAKEENGEINIYYRNGEPRPAIVCRYVGLAGEDDLRGWGQQVAAQAAFNERHLDFSPDIKTQKTTLIAENDSERIYRSYSVCFNLKKLPVSMSNQPDTCRYQNLAAKKIEVQSVPSSEVAKLKAVTEWIEPASDYSAS